MVNTVIVIIIAFIVCFFQGKNSSIFLKNKRIKQYSQLLLLLLYCFLFINILPNNYPRHPEET